MRRMPRSMQFGFLCAVIATAGLASVLDGGVTHKTTRQDLSGPQTIQGWPCDGGPVHLYGNGALAACKLAKDIMVGTSAVPAGSWLHLAPDGAISFIAMSRDSSIGKVTCRGTGPKGYATAFYPGGVLRQCWLAGDQTVAGVPCQGATVLADMALGDRSIRFTANGQVQSCILARDFKGQKKGTRFAQP